MTISFKVKKKCKKYYIYIPKQEEKPKTLWELHAHLRTLEAHS